MWGWVKEERGESGAEYWIRALDQKTRASRIRGRTGREGTRRRAVEERRKKWRRTGLTGARGKRKEGDIVYFGQVHWCSQPPLPK